MASTFSLTGSYQALPPLPLPNVQPLITAAVNVRQSVALEKSGQLTLTDDLPVDLSGPAPRAVVVVIQAIGAPVTVRLSSVLGGAQLVPVDSFFFVSSVDRPFDSVQVVRQPGVEAQVAYYIGQTNS